MKPPKPSPIAEMDDEQFRHYTLAILERELGEEGAARFLRVAQPGSGDYTRDRHKWLKGITFDEIRQDIAKLKERSA
jgi:hypothetical protein